MYAAATICTLLRLLYAAATVERVRVAKIVRVEFMEALNHSHISIFESIDAHAPAQKNSK
jgi:hypothetical protein